MKSNHQETLERAIRLATYGGWDKGTVAHQINGSLYGIPTYPIIIFNQEFSKALWGEETWMLTDYGEWVSPQDYDGHGIGAEELPAWQYHLQQMVISNDPIEYLGQNL